jgi:formylglycine-generating enzyme required for sulfatase activity
MTDNQNQPREYYAVLGGESQVPSGATVLGGIPGVKSRLASPIVAVRIAALSEALNYKNSGLDVIISALQDESMAVKFTAYSLLKDRDEPKIKKTLEQYLPIFEFDVITVDAAGKENSRHRHYAHFFPEDLGNSFLLEMVYIPGGTFMMGSPETESGRDDNESPQHQVTVPAFFAGKYPITQGQWQAVMESNSSYFTGEKHSVSRLSWHDAIEFCDKLSQKTGKKYRLLSEAEWEYACRAGTTTPFYFGETITPELVNYGDWNQEETDVGIFPPNAFGLYDMHGNVWEWCHDRWHDSYATCYDSFDDDSEAPTDGSSWETGTSDWGSFHSSFWRVVRGGFWPQDAVNCRCASREGIKLNYRIYPTGFRVAVTSISC